MKPKFLHAELAKGGWFKLSLAAQMGNIGSEVSRALKSETRNAARFDGAVARALDLFDLTLADSRWAGARRREIARAREVFCDAVEGGAAYGGTLASLLPYFDWFAVRARKEVR